MLVLLILLVFLMLFPTYFVDSLKKLLVLRTVNRLSSVDSIALVVLHHAIVFPGWEWKRCIGLNHDGHLRYCWLFCCCLWWCWSWRWSGLNSVWTCWDLATVLVLMILLVLLCSWCWWSWWRCWWSCFSQRRCYCGKVGRNGLNRIGMCWHLTLLLTQCADTSRADTCFTLAWQLCPTWLTFIHLLQKYK